jgi:hypothetical protein
MKILNKTLQIQIINHQNREYRIPAYNLDDTVIVYN